MSEYVKKVLKGIGSTVLELPCHRSLPTVIRSGFRSDQRALRADSRFVQIGFSRKIKAYRNGKQAK